jgi:uncharacterized integral membrane protein
MARVIVSIVFLLILVAVIVLNIENVTSFNLFGWRIEEIPVTAIALVSFVLGVLYSFLYYLLGYFSKLRRERLVRRGKVLKDREESLKHKKKSVEELLQAHKISGNGGAKTKVSRFEFLSKMAKLRKAETKSDPVHMQASINGKS